MYVSPTNHLTGINSIRVRTRRVINCELQRVDGVQIGIFVAALMVIGEVGYGLAS